MHQFFSKPDWHFSRCGHLDAVVTRQRIAGAPAFMRGLSALFIADIHATARTTQSDLEALRAKITAIAPDLLLLGGDYADEADDAVRLFRALEGLRFPLGGFGVLGNNDREAWDTPKPLRRLMAKAGCRLLVNQAEALRLNGGRLWIAGVDEYRYGIPHAAGLYPADAAPDAYRILLSHYPRLPQPMPDLILSGHTHGGQFNLLGLTPYSIGFESISNRQRSARIAGLKAVKGGQLLVSKGIGASRIQLRLGVRPEINLLQFD